MLSLLLNYAVRTLRGYFFCQDLLALNMCLAIDKNVCSRLLRYPEVSNIQYNHNQRDVGFDHHVNSTLRQAFPLRVIALLQTGVLSLFS